MNDFELIMLFNELFNSTFARLNDFLAGLFAMLAAGYFVAPKLTRPMTWLVITLYTLFSMATIVPTLAAADRFVRAGEQMQIAAVRVDSNLSAFLGALPSAHVVIPTMVILLFSAYAGAMIFFFQARKNQDTR